MPKKKVDKPLIKSEDVDLQQAIQESEKKMDFVMGRFYLDDPIMLGAWTLTDKIPDSKQNTIGIDSRNHPPIVRYNPYFINKLNKEQLECIMASEGFKILLRHPTTRLMTPKAISNLASQITIDQCIMGNPLDINDYFPLPKQFNMEPNSFYEDYFRKLMENLPDVMKKIFNMFSSKEENGKEGESDKGKEYKKFSSSKDALKDYFNPNGNSNQDWSENDLFDADIQNMVDEKKSSSDGWGKYTGSFQGEIIAANTSKISYKDVIRQFNVSVMSTSTYPSRMKVNRRYDLRSPGYRRDYKTKVIFAVDASGSMSDDDLKEGFAVVNSVCRHAQVEYILFDTEIKSVEKKVYKARQSFKINGRGGTNFQDVIDYANKHCADGLIIYTDGQAPAPTKPNTTKVLWLMTSKDNKPPCDWGFRAHLNRFENTH